ncbi:MAG: YitT family protein [Ignavibacteria bacterium]
MALISFNKYVIRDYFFIAAGAAVIALGIGIFLIDAQVVPGGVSGLAMAVYYLSDYKIPVGLMMWLFNIPLYIWGVKELGRSFGARTFFGFSCTSLFIDLFRGDMPGLRFIKLQDTRTIKYLLHNDFLFLILIGSVLLGLGLGVIFKFKGTTAGSDIIVAILQKRYGWKPGTAIMFTDFFVIILAGIIIEIKNLSPQRPAMSLTLYALFLLFISARIVDMIIDGFDYARMACIISGKSDEIAYRIMNDLGRGATGLKAHGLYSNAEREIIFTVITMKELPVLSDIIKETDPSAFVIIGNVHEVLGEGFRRRI